MFDDRNGTALPDHATARIRLRLYCASRRQRTSRRSASAAATAACLLQALGCTIAGSWRTVAVDPPGALFPVEVVSFDGANAYTSIGLFGGKRRTTTGRYGSTRRTGSPPSGSTFSVSVNGFKLDITEGDRMPRSYGARLRLDGKLVLTLREGDAKMTATLAKIDR